MLILKKGVDLTGLKPEMLVGLQVVASVFAEIGADCVVTSALDGKHSRASLHYAGQALDFRTRHLGPNVAKGVAQGCKKALGDQFDVVLEKTHIHVEFQPKR